MSQKTISPYESPISFYECVGQLDSGKLVYVSFGLAGEQNAEIPASDTVASFPAATVYRDVRWKIYEVLDIDSYAARLAKQIALGAAIQAERERLEQTFGLLLTLACIALPQLTVLRYIVFVTMAAEVYKSWLDQKLAVYTAKEIGKLLAGVALRKYIPLAVPKALIKIVPASTKAIGRGLASPSGQEAIGSASDYGVEATFAALTPDEESLSLPEKRLLAIHRLRMVTEPDYLTKLTKLSAIRQQAESGIRQREVQRRQW